MPSPDPAAARRAALTPARVRVDGHQRTELGEGWEAASCAPDACATPAEAAAAGLEWLPATVPGTAAGALRDAGRWRPGEERDLDAEDWWFRTRFEAAPAAAGEEMVLCLGGVATVHEVFLDGELVHEGDSMFAAAAVDLGPLLRAGGSELAIRCRALGPLLRVRRKPRARWRTRLADNGLRFFRTMLLGRCPGFAPGPAAVGPWRPVWIERRRAFAVEELELRPRCEGEDGVLAVRARLRTLGKGTVSAADLVVSGAGEAEAALRVRREDGGVAEVEGEVRLPAVARWWPHTHGEPALHEVTLRVAGAEWEAGIDAGRVGFRSLATGAGPGHDPLEDGLDLHLNGVRTFARGAVWTPVDPVGLAPSRERLRAALEQVREAGMNMVRIPGTAAYEPQAFHDLCDELGILVWQDFAFANFDYPIAEEGFRAAVEAEAREQLSALAGHPSLAVLCGNSEVEQQVAMLGLDPELGRGELFGELLPRLAGATVDAPYVPSSPCGGELPFRPDRGIANYYGVGGYRRPLSDARLAAVRFAGECLAFANVPEPSGVEAILPEAPADVVVHHPRWKAGVPRDAGTGWDFDDVRDHYLGELFGVEAGELRRYDHERYLELSRAVSGEAMAAVFGEWRRAGSPSGGGLVLWLRDLVPGAGWGLVDAQGAPKRVLQRLRPALAPTAAWITDEGLGGLAVHAANDGPEPLRARLRIALYSDFERAVGTAEEEVEIPPHGCIERDLEALLGRFADASWAYRFGPPAQDVVLASLDRLEVEGPDPAPLAQAVHFPAGRPAGAETAARLGVEAEAARAAGGEVTLTVRSRRFLYGLRAEARGLRAEEPWTCVEPGVERRLALRPLAGEEPPSAVGVGALNLSGRVSAPIE
ncbi:MAG: glycoside hydrolase family 2 protein [Actinobacteria bacterium]|nr:glycoside hydrolase family 2 protein [Actinomycetota bacterium]